MLTARNGKVRWQELKNHTNKFIPKRILTSNSWMILLQNFIKASRILPAF